MTKPDGGPAFPGPRRPIILDGTSIGGPPGMTLRQYYAGQVMPGLCANHNIASFLHSNDIAKLAFALADAMLAHEEGEKGDE